MDSMIDFSSDLLDKGGLINLSGEPMYLLSEKNSGPNVQQVPSNALVHFNTSGVKPIRIDSTIMVGNIEEYDGSQVVIVKEWRFDINESFDDELISSDICCDEFEENDLKIFNQKEMLEYWEENSGSPS